MNQTVQITSASISEAGIIRSIAEKTWPVCYDGIISKEQISYMLDLIYSNQSIHEQFEAGHCFYFAVKDHLPIGFASVKDEGEIGCKLHKLYVLPGYQKSGAGTDLINAAMNFTRMAGQKRLFLQVNKKNLNAIVFYRKKGFEIVDKISLNIGSGFYIYDYVMERFL